jgi:acetoacetyl-CoA synthetase
MVQFMRSVGTQTEDYSDLHRWSVAEPEQFWSAVAAYTGIKFEREATTILRQTGAMSTACWFQDATLNFAANMLAEPDDSIAVIYRDERGRRSELTRAELVTQVAALAAGMRLAGVGAGDRVVAALPNCPETVCVMLAAASIGAVFSSCSPDFGERAILDRFSQIEPCLLFVCDGYQYAGKEFDCGSKNQQIAAALPTLKQMVVVPFLGASPDVTNLQHASLYKDFIIPGSEPEYASLPFNHPLFILYSSGTTGQPKCIVHGAGGTLLQHKKELMLHTDLHEKDRIFFYTTCGWMMWNWLLSSLSVKATVVLYDGSPFHPGSEALPELVIAEGINIFGVSPRYLTAFENSVNEMACELPDVRTVLSTGAPLALASYDFVQSTFGKHIQLSSISGGTDIVSCFALGNPLLPVRRGELQCRGLGMAVEVYNEAGESVINQPGELVCTRPFPSMPVGFWGDAGAAYEAAYFSRFPGVWAHGDLAELNDHGGLRIYGRSDAVLNPGGVRIGTTEVCEPAMSFVAVEDCIAISQSIDSDSRIVLFVVLRPGVELDESLQQKLRKQIRADASPRHVPAKILQVPEIPRTQSGKAVELAVRSVVHNEPVNNLAAIANPEALDFFRNRPELLD